MVKKLDVVDTPSSALILIVLNPISDSALGLHVMLPVDELMLQNVVSLISQLIVSVSASVEFVFNLVTLSSSISIIVLLPTRLEFDKYINKYFNDYPDKFDFKKPLIPSKYLLSSYLLFEWLEKDYSFDLRLK